MVPGKLRRSALIAKILLVGTDLCRFCISPGGDFEEKGTRRQRRHCQGIICAGERGLVCYVWLSSGVKPNSNCMFTSNL